MKYFVAIVAMALAPAYAFSAESASDGEGWISLFDGKTLDGWKVGGDPKSFHVEDGQLIAQAVGGNAHLFYAGDVKQHNFKNFHLKMDVMTTKGSNSGIYIHTAFQESDWPHGVRDPGQRIAWRSQEERWPVWDQGLLRSPGERQYLVHPGDHRSRQADHLENRRQADLRLHRTGRLEGGGRRLSSGTFAIQAHDPKSKVYFKNILVKPLED